AEAGVSRVVVGYDDETVGRACLEAAHRLVMAAVHDLPLDVARVVGRLRDVAYLHGPAPGTRALVEAARRRGLPHRRLDAGDLVLLGQGHRRRRILAAETDRTSAVARAIAQDRELTRHLLRDVGVPVPDGRVVASAEDAWEAARTTGGPVVVRP